jgi:hypothetical protein
MPCVIEGLSVPEAKFLRRNPDKSLKSFLLDIHSHLYSFALRFLFLQTHATSYYFYSSVTVVTNNLLGSNLTYTVKEKGGKPDIKPSSLWFKKYIRKPQV